MADLDGVLDEFPGPVRETITSIGTALPDEMRRQGADLLDSLSPSLKVLKNLLPHVLEHYKPAFGTKSRIAIVGPANVGKSTLYNQLVTRREDRAQVSAVPGTTRQNQAADTGLFVLVDTPGADAVGAVGERERQIAFQAAADADFLVILLEATRGVKQAERSLYEDLQRLGKPSLVVLNKMDLVPKAERELVLASAAHNLDLEPAAVLGTVATEGENVGRVILAVARSDPELVKAIAEALPEFRARLAWQRISAAAGSAGVVGWVPLPFADLLPLIVIQSGLVLSLARIYGYEVTPRRARELIATFGLGLAGRTLYQQLSKLAGVPGWVLSAAVAAATTVAIGYGALFWFAYGEKPTRASLQKLASEVGLHLREQLRGLGRKRPDRATLRQRIRQALPVQTPRVPGRNAKGSPENP
jgi:small GTP-binding protein